MPLNESVCKQCQRKNAAEQITKKHEKVMEPFRWIESLKEASADQLVEAQRQVKYYRDVQINKRQLDEYIIALCDHQTFDDCWEWGVNVCGIGCPHSQFVMPNGNPPEACGFKLEHTVADEKKLE